MKSIGYVAMTMQKIGQRAGVSTEFLYKTFVDKPSLVRQLLDVTLAGDDEPVPMAQRPAILRMIAEPDPDAVLNLYSELSCEVNTRASALLLAIADAAHADPRLAEIWHTSERQHLAGSAAVAGDIGRKAHLLVDQDQARDIIWSLTGPRLYHMLVIERGWPTALYTRWLAETLRRSLLPTPTG